MTNSEISDLLGIDRTYLSRKCTRDDGVVLWMLRECLINNHKLTFYSQARITELMQELLKPQARMSKVYTKLIICGKVKLLNDETHQHIMSFYTRSPQFTNGITYE